MGILSEDVLAYIGRKAPARTEVVTRRDIRKYAIASGQTQRKYLDGDVAPPLFHVALFWDVVPRDELTPDGVSVDRLLPIHEAQLLTCLRLTRLRVGLLINFHAPLLKHGVRRLQA